MIVIAPLEVNDVSQIVLEQVSRMLLLAQPDKCCGGRWFTDDLTSK
jgi:hypothetical protein